MKVLLLSHGHLAEEVKNTAKMIIGKIENVDSLPLVEGANISDYEQNVASLIHQAEDILILVDLLGGTPFLTCAKLYHSLNDSEKRHIRIITGMNLAMVLEVMNSMETSTLDELCDAALRCGRTGIIDFVKKSEGRENE